MVSQPVSHPMPEWMNQALAQGLPPEQALAWMGLALLQRMRQGEGGWTPAWEEGPEELEAAGLLRLRQRLELTALALNTGAPLSTAEVTWLLGARPGGPVVERGELRAERLSRNVWSLSRIERRRDDGGGRSGFQDGFASSFRRRL
ncbi:MAG: hypothetical protein VKJ66_10230 [Synechococcus sp.]|nr:hypothetical protein [Synechococcus sp.]